MWEHNGKAWCLASGVGNIQWSESRGDGLRYFKGWKCYSVTPTWQWQWISGTVLSQSPLCFVRITTVLYLKPVKLSLGHEDEFLSIHAQCG